MVFGFGKRKKPAAIDPIAAFDGLIEDLERQGAEIRRSAATLLSLKGQLGRDVKRYEQRHREVQERLEVADRKHDAHARRTLERDRQELEGLLESTRRAIAAAEEDARLLLDAAAELADRIAELKAERNSARARLLVDRAVTAALRERYEKFERVLALDEARDEVERAKALADIYREDARLRR